jgi:hypothetical protein
VAKAKTKKKTRPSMAKPKKAKKTATPPGAKAKPRKGKKGRGSTKKGRKY